MTSILTNNGAIVALQTLKNINGNLNKAQSEISTGKTINNAKDNASVWAVTKVMEADVSGFKAITSNLTVAGSAVGTAREGAEDIATVLGKIRDSVIAAGSATADTAAIQVDVDGYIKQIETIVADSQVNGVNLLNNATTREFLAGVTRDAAGSVSQTTIDVAGADLGTGVYAAKAVLTGSEGASNAADTAAFFIDAGDTTAKDIVIDSSAGAFAAGDKITISIGNRTASYTVTNEDVATAADEAATDARVAVGLKTAIDKLGIEGLSVAYDAAAPGTLSLSGSKTIGANTTTTAADLAVSVSFKNAGAGELAKLTGFDVTSADAMADIQSMLKSVATAAASLGSAGARIEAQSDFLSKLSDSVTVAVSGMVDADMEEASARLQALQTQQQLGIQSLSIANQAPSAILSLFR